MTSKTSERTQSRTVSSQKSEATPVFREPIAIPSGGRQRTIIEGVKPEIDGGRYPIKRTVGEVVHVEADIFADGHDVLSAVLKYRQNEQENWTEVRMAAKPNDRWQASFTPSKVGSYLFTIESWVDDFKTWRRDLEKKVKANQEVSIEYRVGIQLIEEAAKRAKGRDRDELQQFGNSLALDVQMDASSRLAVALDTRLAELMQLHSERRHATQYHRELRVVVDPVVARFGAWYEFFPRSCSADPGKHGTFQDCESMLPRVAEMGFDIIYLPPIHPIGRSFRKGRNNRPAAEPGEPGSPWGIGAQEGGHKAIHPELGTLDDFRRFVSRAKEHNIQIALDIAFQCSPDHPYVREHPEWFRKRPDGSIQYAENPPKKYQDIYPIYFETEDWRALWIELKSIFEFWISQGIKVYRVDNPHTKAFRFWEWCITELKKNHPDLIFLSEAFTRPKMMYNLAKLGFTQSYNYFPWRNTKRDLIDYFTELTQTEVREYFRPNLWPNTPDILTQYLQYGGRPAFMNRLILAATLGASYGIYGPAYELCENQPREIGSEEYLDSEKYQIRHWNLNSQGNLTELITRINRIRRENPAFHTNENLKFHAIDNEQLIAYTKHTDDFENIVLTVVNLDPHHTQSGWLSLDLSAWEMKPTDSFQVHDLLTDARYLWNGLKNYVELNPVFVPAHVFRLRRWIRTEQDFDYFI